MAGGVYSLSSSNNDIFRQQSLTIIIICDGVTRVVASQQQSNYRGTSEQLQPRWWHF